MPGVLPATDVDHSSEARPNHRLFYLDGWRGMCILAVIAGHFAPVHFIDFGNLGVEMFFVLSGRLMADILFIEKFPLKQFYIRRFSRVWPGLFVYVVFCVSVFARKSGFLHVGLPAATASLTFITNYKIFLLGQTQLLDHTWSLSIEEHSYIFLGIIAYYLRNKSVKLARYFILFCAVAMATNGIFRTYVSSNNNFDYPGHKFDIYWLSDTRCASIFFAAFIYLHLKTRVKIKWNERVSMIFALLFGMMLFASFVPESIQYTVGTICLAFAVCSLETAGTFYQKIFSQKYLVLFGTYSFSIYVWQQIFYKLFQSLRDSGALTQMEGLVLRPAFVVGACGAGILSYYLIETPARRYINKHWMTRNTLSNLVAIPARN
jgi:peptidoglycan/LPS O-acetylase OafA/YrhL